MATEATRRFPWLDANCARGAQAAVDRRIDRERVEHLRRGGVLSEEDLRSSDFFDAVDNVHVLDPAWLEDEFIAQLEAAEAAGAAARDDDQANGADDGVLDLDGLDEMMALVFPV